MRCHYTGSTSPLHCNAFEQPTSSFTRCCYSRCRRLQWTLADYPRQEGGGRGISVPETEFKYSNVTLTFLQDHSAIEPPKGARFTSIPVGNDLEEIAAFYPDNSVDKNVQHAFIAIHGKHRDGGLYWTIVNEALKQQRNKTISGKARNSITIAPQFFSTKYNSGQYTDKQLAWTDLNAWQAGSRANHPSGTRLTSIDALSAMVEAFSNRTIYPSMKNVTIVGHGGGGQLVQRFAAIGKDSPPNLHVRYIHGDASTCAYFSKDRPLEQGNTSACKLYNTWRYGFDHFPGTAAGSLKPEQYFRQYISRDVVSLVGLSDVESNGDQSCMAKLQGGRKRRDRNLVWYKYVHSLARTGENMDGFPGLFDHLPDWSLPSERSIKLRLSAVKDVSHDIKDILASDCGQSALLSDDHVELGWRPGHQGFL